MLIVAAPVLTSLGQGPTVGKMLFGQYLDARMIRQLQAITNVKFSVTTLSGLTSSDTQIANTLQSNPNAVFAKISGNSVDNYFLLNDIDSNPTFVLEISLSRATYQEGIWVEDIFIVAAVSLWTCCWASP
jgi:sensor domain CHASE-containing protein